MKKSNKPYLSYYVKPHKKISRVVRPEDIEVVLEDAHILFNLCFIPHGIYPSALAMAHSQINKTDPLRFFVTVDKRIIINPIITRHTEVAVQLEEACMSFPMNAPIKVDRYHKITVNYTEINSAGEKIERKDVKLSGREAQVFQHELGHMNASYIYNIKDYKPVPKPEPIKDPKIILE